jgi:hypothetical protein
MSMKPLPVLLVSWVLAGLGSVVGSMLGNALGSTGLKIGAVVGGAIAVVGAVALSGHFAWIPRASRALAALGGLVAYGVAAALAVTHLSTPVVPVLSCALVGAGVLLGAGVSKGLGRGA